MKLPKNITFTEADIPEEILNELEEFISDEISNRIEFCHEGFNYSLKIKIKNIMWDVDED